MKPLRIFVATGVSLLGLGASLASGDEARLHTVVNGTAHEALFEIAFDGNKGLAVGAAGHIVATEDSGATWKSVAPPTELSLLGVDLKGDNAVIVGQQGLILRRDGSDWKKVESGADKKRLFSVGINSKGQAVVVGAFGTVLKSEDGGATWTPISPDWEKFSEKGMDPGVQPHLYAAKIDEAGVVTVAGEFGLILRSKSGHGQDWKTLHSGEASIFAFNLRDDGVGYAVGQNGTVLRSGDGGGTWQPIDVDSKAILLGVKSAPDGRVVVAGMRDMLVSSDDGKTWSHVREGEAMTSWYHGVGQASASAPILVVGHSGQIIRVGS